MACHQFVGQMGPLFAQLCQQSTPSFSSTTSLKKCLNRADVIGELLTRLHQRSGCSKAVLITQVLYMSRIYASRDFSACNMSQIVLGTFVLACKICDDAYYSNSFYATLANVSLAKLNEIEEQAILALNWDLFIDAAQYKSVEESIAKQLDNLDNSPSGTSSPLTNSPLTNSPLSPLSPLSPAYQGSPLKVAKCLKNAATAPTTPLAPRLPKVPSVCGLLTPPLRTSGGRRMWDRKDAGVLGRN
eukprot:Sspe_Gene.96787::Locus_69981_Transcript_1_1_Confidence_1.000_Length_955::g.96787::m.96787